MTTDRFLSLSKPRIPPVLARHRRVQTRQHIWCLVHGGCSIMLLIFLVPHLVPSPHPPNTDARRRALCPPEIRTPVQIEPRQPPVLTTRPQHQPSTGHLYSENGSSQPQPPVLPEDTSPLRSGLQLLFIVAISWLAPDPIPGPLVSLT